MRYRLDQLGHLYVAQITERAFSLIICSLSWCGQLHPGFDVRRDHSPCDDQELPGSHHREVRLRIDIPWGCTTDHDMLCPSIPTGFRFRFAQSNVPVTLSTPSGNSAQIFSTYFCEISFQILYKMRLSDLFCASDQSAAMPQTLVLVPRPSLALVCNQYL